MTISDDLWKVIIAGAFTIAVAAVTAVLGPFLLARGDKNQRDVAKADLELAEKLDAHHPAEATALREQVIERIDDWRTREYNRKMSIYRTLWRLAFPLSSVVLGSIWLTLTSGALTIFGYLWVALGVLQTTLFLVTDLPATGGAATEAVAWRRIVRAKRRKRRSALKAQAEETVKQAKAAGTSGQTRRRRTQPHL